MLYNKYLYPLSTNVSYTKCIGNEIVLIISRIEATRLSVLVGEYDVNNSRSDGFEVTNVVQHPDFNKFTYDNDIAVLRLAEPLPDSLYRPACLPGLFPRRIFLRFNFNIFVICVKLNPFILKTYFMVVIKMLT